MCYLHNELVRLADDCRHSPYDDPGVDHCLASCHRSPSFFCRITKALDHQRHYPLTVLYHTPIYKLAFRWLTGTFTQPIPRLLLTNICNCYLVAHLLADTQQHQHVVALRNAHGIQIAEDVGARYPALGNRHIAHTKTILLSSRQKRDKIRYLCIKIKIGIQQIGPGYIQIPVVIQTQNDSFSVHSKFRIEVIFKYSILLY